HHKGKTKVEPGVLELFTWEEVGLRTGKGNFKEERWLVINRKVYDVSQFYLQHPGGPRLIRHYSGQDATDAFIAFHKDEDLVKKYLNSLLIGELTPDQPSCEPTKNEMLVHDFHELRMKVKKMGLLKSSVPFFAFIFLHAFLLDMASWFTIWYFGKSWVPFLIGVAMFTIQYGFFQHDLGHISVFQKPKWNRLAHTFVMGILKGGPKSWWIDLHNRHHAKPNCFLKDPDLNMHPFLFSLGKILNILHSDICSQGLVILAPLTFIAFVHFVSKDDKDNEKNCKSFLIVLFLKITYFHRSLESTWFLWVSQMNHIPMNISYDQNLDWVSSQLSATCNVDHSWFNDWFTGHLNFQIEHHLFPTMPRHNYCKVAPLVKSLCAKHGVHYECKPILTAFADILHSLKEYGQDWQEAYLHELGVGDVQTATEIH
uniref:Cytochrome b5 heme-binding domain-containing protein n=1 Tax=Pseudonaja textilis TaxID=8673 RepID=A0A670Z5G6_PSETE